MEIDGDRLFALVMRGAGKPVSEAPLETHRRYIDIQYIVSGVDRMGWKPASECRPGRGYDEVRDLEFHDPSPEVWINVSAGRMAIFFPEDAHAPLAHTGVSLQKIVVKVARSGPEAPAFPCRPTRVSGS
jgi:YhcH/YjgK/YiaL family protein